MTLRILFAVAIFIVQVVLFSRSEALVPNIEIGDGHYILRSKNMSICSYPKGGSTTVRWIMCRLVNASECPDWGHMKDMGAYGVDVFGRYGISSMPPCLMLNITFYSRETRT